MNNRGSMFGLGWQATLRKTWLAAGLGNPEGKYFNTYHNVGFVAADLLAARLGAATDKETGQRFLSDDKDCTKNNLSSAENTGLLNINGNKSIGADCFKKKGNQMIACFNAGGNKVYLLKPLTYMNLSGQAVVAVTRKYKIAPENIIVFADDLYIDKGNIRISFGGSNAGHNGIKSINELLGTNQYTKIKIGIKPEKPQHNLADYVLKRIDTESRPLVDAALNKAVQAAAAILYGESLQKVQSVFNTRQSAEQ